MRKVVVPVHEDLRLNDRDEPGLLGEGGEERQGIGVVLDARGRRKARPHPEDGPPLGEARPEVGILGEAGAQAVKPLGKGLGR